MIPLWFKREIHLGMTGPDVNIVRRKFGLVPGPYDRSIQVLVMSMARKKKVETDGEVNKGVAEMLGPAADEDQLPSWYERPLELWCEGPDVAVFRRAIGMKDDGDNRFHPEEEAAVRRLQSAKGLVVDGKVNEELAKIIGEAE